MPTTPAKPTASKPRRLDRNLTTVTAISFSLTFVGVSLALLAGILPPRLASLPMPVDMGVVLLVVPLCALVFAMTAEVLRAAMHEPLPRRRQRIASVLGEGFPGRGDG